MHEEIRGKEDSNMGKGKLIIVYTEGHGGNQATGLLFMIYSGQPRRSYSRTVAHSQLDLRR